MQLKKHFSPRKCFLIYKLCVLDIDPLRIFKSIRYKLILKETLWTCAKCTYASNKSDLVNCSLCSTERDENEIFRCLFCGTKNPLSNRNCIKCDTYFSSAAASTDIRFHKRTSSSSSSLASASYKSSPVLSTLVPNDQNYSHSNGASAQLREDYATHSPVIPRNYLNNAYQFN